MGDKLHALTLALKCSIDGIVYRSRVNVGAFLHWRTFDALVKAGYLERHEGPLGVYGKPTARQKARA